MEKKTDAETYFTPKQAAGYLNLSLSTIKNYIYADKLKTLKTPGGHHRIRKSELLATMGDMGILVVKSDDTLEIMDASAASIMMAFKALGPIGNSLIIHCKNVAGMVYKLSKAIGLTDSEAGRIKIAGLIHDIGHIGIGQGILSKVTLTGEDYEALKLHSKNGKDILSAIKPLRDIAEIIGQHHERPDGRGYPDGLKGDEIDKGAQIIAVTEAYDSMVSLYSYKKVLSKDHAISELMQNRGSQFDGNIVEAFVKTL